MSLNRFLDLLARSPSPLLSDGAMGTMLNARGASFEACFDALNLSRPALVAEVHREYIEAGANIIDVVAYPFITDVDNVLEEMPVSTWGTYGKRFKINFERALELALKTARAPLARAA